MEQNKKQIKKQRGDRSKEASTKVSNTNKALALAGVANVWLLLNHDKISDCDIKCLLITLILFALSIFAEYFQYALEAFVHKYFAEHMPMTKDAEGNLSYTPIPRVYATIAWVSWIIKIICTFAGYIILSIVLFKTFWPC